MPPSRTSWAVQPNEELKWTSTLVLSSELPAIPGWHRHLPHDGVLWLKDTMTSYYENRLRGPITYQYEVPEQTTKPTRDFDVVEQLRMEAARPHKTLEIRLIASGNAFTHYLGQWTVVEYVDDPARVRAPHTNRITLRRLRTQMAIPGITPQPERKRFRSTSELRHKAVIEAALPGWRVRHEPEAIVVPQMPLICDGARCPWVGDGITIDYVAVSPDPVPRRLCIESKCCEEDATPDALERCRVLRDKSMVRVLLVYDHGAALRWLDFGTDAAPLEPPRRSERFPVEIS